MPNVHERLLGFFAYFLIHGFFPSSPSQPHLAVSVELLEFYRALFERSCNAINTLAAALHTHYGEKIQDPFCHSLASAVQWYDILQVEVKKQINSALRSSCCDKISASKPALFIASDAAIVSATHTPSRPPATSVLSLERCPACFGDTIFGRPLAEGGDFHVATDGNFHHHHHCSSGDCPAFYDPAYFLSKGGADAMGERIRKQCKKPAKSYSRDVPSEAIDTCEASYKATGGNKRKADIDCYNNTGLMALICHHDIPLFLANIDSLREQQKYTILPLNATAVILYDFGCVLHRMLSKDEILNPSILKRICFSTSVMHVYGHEWTCWLVFNSRMAVSLGLSDGEGTEHLWSRLIKLITIKCSSSVC
ncbi:hypothetical protein HD554DRAFT_2202366 [Boletus coccyginus]|nr:hypothetical protein HD554DRAFT_2202366 [Boletus coccyginus]